MNDPDRRVTWQATSRRRKFLATLLGGAAAAWPLAARAQQASDAAHRRAHAAGRGRSGRQARIAAFLQGLAQLGWIEGRNVRIEYSLGRAANADRLSQIRGGIWSRSRRTSSWPLARRACARLLQVTRTVPIVFATGRRSGRRRVRRKPGAAGRQRHRFYARSNTASSAKWLELLKEIAPGVTRAAVLRES